MTRRLIALALAALAIVVYRRHVAGCAALAWHPERYRMKHPFAEPPI